MTNAKAFEMFMNTKRADNYRNERKDDAEKPKKNNKAGPAQKRYECKQTINH